MLVGCGLRGKQWARVVKENPNCEMRAYVDINPEAINRVRKAVGDENVPEYEILNEALNKVEVDAVLVITPPQYHYKQSVAILNKNLHLLVEKPLTEDFKTSLEIVKLAEKKERMLIVGMQFRYMPITQAYKELVQNGRLGAPNFAQFSYIRTRDPMSRSGEILNQYCYDMAHTFLLEQAIHHLDLIRYVYSTDVKTVQAFEWNPIHWKHNPYKQDPNVSLLLTLKNGMHVNYMGAWISGNKGINEGIDFRWRTDLEEGIIIQPDLFGQGRRLHYASRKAKKITYIHTDPIEPFITDTNRLLTEFYECWKEKQSPKTSGKDHLKTLSTILACIESSINEKKVVIDEFQEKLNFPKEWI